MHRSSHAVAKQRIMPISYARLALGGAVSDERRFVDHMAARFGVDTHIVPVGRARSGIYLLVQLAMTEQRRKVLMSPYTIPDVITMVELAGGVPVFFDFEADSTATDVDGLARLMGDDVACVFVTHHHLNEPQLPEIAALCRRHGCYFFDDCAITFGGTFDGKPLGTLTDASVFSFSAFKLLNFFWGGMVTTRDPALGQRLAAAVARWPRLTARDYRTSAKGCLAYDLASRPLVFGAAMFPIFQRRARHSGAPKTLENARLETESLNPTLTARPALAAFAEWNRKLDTIDTQLARRREIATIYRRRLGALMAGAKTADGVLEGSCFVNFPVVVPEARASAVCLEMLLAGFDVGRNLYPNCHRHPKFTHLTGCSETVDRFTRSTLYLPTHFGVTPDYADAIAQRLVAALAATAVADNSAPALVHARAAST